MNTIIGKWPFEGKEFRTLRYNNETFPEYMVCDEGCIWDFTKPYGSRPCTKIALNYPDKKKASPYTRASVRKPSGGRTTILVHIAVCDTWNRHTLPVPEGVTQEEWDNCPESIKNFCRFGFQVNHIDHDQHNHHPSNLEYTTAKENQQAYQEHRVRNL